MINNINAPCRQTARLARGSARVFATATQGCLSGRGAATSSATCLSLRRQAVRPARGRESVALLASAAQQQTVTQAAAPSTSGAASAATPSPSTTKAVIRGVVFDMDGTLTVPAIDLAFMRQRLGIAPTDDILAAVDSWDPEKRAWGYKVILDLEIEARSRLKIMPGVPELSAMLDARGIPRGLLTRNIRSAVEHFHENFPLPAFAPSVTRECAFEYKPDPAGLLHMCDTWGIFPRECVLVGDSLKDDVRCGNRAGAVTVWFNFENKPTPNFADMDPEQRPTHVVTSMQQLQRIIEEQYHLLQPAVAAKAVAAN